MSDDDRKRVAPAPSYLPALSPAQVPHAAVPSLPSSSGAFWGTRTRIMRKDAEFIRQHADLLAAKQLQTTNFKALVDARIALALKLAELATLPEMVEHEYVKGRRDRAHELRMVDIAHQTAETQAMIGLAAVQRQLAQYLPTAEKQSASPQSAPAGLSPDDVVAAVDEITDHMPDVPPEVRKHLTVLLSAYLKERRK